MRVCYYLFVIGEEENYECDVFYRENEEILYHKKQYSEQMVETSTSVLGFEVTENATAGNHASGT